MSEIASSAEGTESVHISPTTRYVAIVTSAVYPNKVRVLSFEDPRTQIILDVPRAESEAIIRMFFINFAATGDIFFASQLRQMSGRSRLLGAPLKRGTGNGVSMKELPWEWLSHAEANGTPLVSVVTGTSIYVAANMPGSLKHRPEPALIVDLGIQRSEAMQFRQGLQVVARTARLVVIQWSDHTSRLRQYWASDPNVGTWRQIPFGSGPYPYSWRPFGRWVTSPLWVSGMAKESPGRRMRRQEVSRTGKPFDVVFARDYLPGTISFYNVQTGHYFTHETGQGDSEVIWMDGDRVLLRMNDALCWTAIDGSRLLPPQLLVKHEVVPDIHWAFAAA